MKPASIHRAEHQTGHLPKSWSGIGQSLARATFAMQRMSGMIAEQEARLRLILSCVDDGLVVMKKDGSVVVENPAGRDILNVICTCEPFSKKCLFHTALFEMASGTTRLVRECGPFNNPIRCDFKIVKTESGEEQIAVRLERIPRYDTKSNGWLPETESRFQFLDNESGKKKAAVRSNTLLRRVADAVKAREPAFAGKIKIEESSDLHFKGVNDKHVVQMLAYLVHQIICDINASGIGTEIRLNAGVEGDEPLIRVTHDGPPSDAPVINNSVNGSSNSIRLQGHLPLFAELRAVQNGLTLKSSRVGKYQRIEIRKRSSLG